MTALMAPKVVQATVTAAGQLHVLDAVTRFDERPRQDSNL